MASEDRLDREALEAKELAATATDRSGLARRHPQAQHDLYRAWRSDDQGPRLDRNRRRIGYVVEVSVADENEICPSDVLRQQTYRAVSRASIVVCIQQDHSLPK